MTLVIDNGAFEIKAGWAEGRCVRIQNALMRSRDRRVWLANDVEQCRDLTSLQIRRPIERGQLISWELEKAIWDWAFDTKTIEPTPDDFGDTTLILTETPGSLAAVTVNTDQIVLEEYEFGQYRRTTPQALVAAGANQSEGHLVIDIGFSATQIVPVYNNMAITNGINRVDVGGKVITNYLKEMVSHRYYNMLEESAILSSLKEKACFVARNFDATLREWRDHKHMFDFGYALPDHRLTEGRVLETPEEIKQWRADQEHQVLVLGNERFTAPEALFEPRILGFDQAGVVEAAARSVLASPADVQPLLWANIIITGGGAQLPNLQDRIRDEIRSYAPNDCIVNITSPQDPVEAAWAGGVTLSNRSDLDELCITRKDYLETGESVCLRKFGRMK